MNINFGGSVLKREAKEIDKVEKQLLSDGWEKTAHPTGRLRYYQKSGINITALGGPNGTVIFPSGPVRGKAFGSDFNLFSRTSVIGAGAKSKEKSKNKPQSEPRDGTEVMN